METITVIGVDSTQPIIVTGKAPSTVASQNIVVTGEGQISQIIVSGQVAATGPQGPAGKDGINGSNAIGGGSWGLIAGNIINQEDLQTSLDTKMTKTSNLSDIVNAGQARINLGLQIGTNVEAYNAPTTTNDYLRGDKTFQNFNTAVRANRLSDLGAPTASINMAGQRIVNIQDPVSGQDAATKLYVDSLAQGLSVKASVNAATTTPLPASTYAANVLTATGNGVLSVDGVALVAGNRLLVKDEPNAYKNGIYVVSDPGSTGTTWMLTRSADMDASNEVSGAFTFIVSGTINANTGYIVNTPGPFTLGVTNITFTQFSTSGVPDATTTVKGKTLLGAAGGAATFESDAAKYTKPGTGIPKTDLDTATQTSLAKADTALQPSSGTTTLTADQVFTGINTFNQGIVLKDSAANLWLLGVNTDGSLQTTAYYEGSFSYAFITEDGFNIFASEDSLTYLAQEA